MNHRKYVGGNWDTAGLKQIEFLKEEGLQPYHKLIDVACGCFRSGRYFIDYLDPSNYFGIEKHSWLVFAGMEQELTEEQKKRRPTVRITDKFDFFTDGHTKFDYAIAKSLFTHLTKEKIKQCLDNLLPEMAEDGKFYASISLGNSENNLKEDSETKRFKYTFEEIKELAIGWNVTQLGNEGCFKQTMLKFVPIKKDIKVTIVTAAFRAENMDKVLDSIKKQMFKDFEWVIVNDAQQEVREWYKQSKINKKLEGLDVRFIDMEKQMGRFGLYSRNIGAMVAKYDRITFLDDDNMWTSKHLSSLIKMEVATGKIPYCWMHIKGKKPGSTFERIKKTHFGRQGIDLGCILYRKDHFIKYGYFQDTRQVTYDYDYMFKIFTGEGVDNFVCTEKASLIFHHKRY